VQDHGKARYDGKALNHFLAETLREQVLNFPNDDPSHSSTAAGATIASM